MAGRRHRWFVAAFAAVALSAALALPGFASGLSWSSKTLGGSGATVSKCDSDGVSVIQNLSGANVVSVTVSGIAAACATGALSVTVDNATTSSSGTGTVPAGGGSMTVALTVAVPAKDAEEIDVAITGP
jgi:hypothetical protein